MAACTAWYSDIDSFEKLQAAFADDIGGTGIHITLSSGITFAGMLTAQEGKTFYIDGKAYTLKDVFLGGSNNAKNGIGGNGAH